MTARGWRKGEPIKYLAGHNRLKSPVEYIVDATTGCWIWQRGTNSQGYGQLKRDGRRQQAHRYFYEQAKGPIPAGLYLDHLCRTPACVNPDHLEPVTNAQNQHRGAATSLTAEDVKQIRRSPLPGSQLAAKFGVAAATISRIRNRRVWKLEQDVEGARESRREPQALTGRPRASSLRADAPAPPERRTRVAA